MFIGGGLLGLFLANTMMPIRRNGTWRYKDNKGQEGSVPQSDLDALTQTGSVVKSSVLGAGWTGMSSGFGSRVTWRYNDIVSVWTRR